MAVRRSICPGQSWLDTSGNRIQADGGSMRHEDATFCRSRENKGKTTPGV